MDLLKDSKEWLSGEWRTVYFWFCAYLKKFGEKSSRITSANTGGIFPGFFKGLGPILDNVCNNFEKFPW